MIWGVLYLDSKLCAGLLGGGSNRGGFLQCIMEGNLLGGEDGRLLVGCDYAGVVYREALV